MSGMSTRRALQKPQRAQAALSKLMKKMPAAQRNQIQSQLGDIFGVKGGGLGGQGRVMGALADLPQQPMPDQVGYMQPNVQAGNAIQQVLANAGQTGPGWQQAMPALNPYPGITPPPGQPGINPPGTPPVGINPPPPDRDATGMPIGGGAATPQLNPNQIQGTMGMAGQPPPPPSLAQTAAAQTAPPSVAAAGATGTTAPATPSTATATSPPGGTAGTTPAVPGANAATTPPSATSANVSPTIASRTAEPAATGATSNSLINTGVVQPGVTTAQLQNTVAGSGALNNPMFTGKQIFQQQYNPMINMQGQSEIQSQFATPGRSAVGGQFGEGGLAATQQQQAVNQAAMQGTQAAQGMIGANINQQLQGQKIGSQMDLAGRQQAVQQANQILGPALSGGAAAFQQGLGGMTRAPQYMGF